MTEPRKHGVRYAKQCWSLVMPSTQKLVLVCLAQYAGVDGKCWPAVSTLSRQTGLSDRGVQRAIAWLAAQRAIRREERCGTTTTYWVTPGLYSPLNVVHPHPRTSVTPERASPVPLNRVHPTPEPRSPRSSIEVPVEGSAIAGGAVTAKEYLFGPAREALVAQGMNDKNARSLLGRACAVHGDEEAARGVRAFIEDHSLELPSRVAAFCNRRRSRGARDRDLASVDYTAGLPHGAAA